MVFRPEEILAKPSWPRQVRHRRRFAGKSSDSPSRSVCHGHPPGLGDTVGTGRRRAGRFVQLPKEPAAVSQKNDLTVCVSSKKEFELSRWWQEHEAPTEAGAAAAALH